MDDDVAYVRVVGVSFYQEALERCCAGEAVRFVHEPDNPHDETAIRVESLLKETIGYLPRRSWAHHAVHQLGRGISGVIHSIGYSRSCQLGALVSIAVCDDEPAVQSYFSDGAPLDPPHGGFRYWIKRPTAAGPRAEARK
jgi:hypothetical protein